MERSRRLVLLDPGLASAVGHHSDVNGVLLPALRRHGWQVELWADAQAAQDPALAAQLPELRPLLHNGGYIDPRHWCDLPGTLHQAALLRPQLQAAAPAEPSPVAAWVAHSLVPFQLIALAQLLQRQPPAQVVISLMFAPGEVFAGQPELDLQAQRQGAELNARSALAALALAASRGGHQLLLGAGSEQLIQRYAPLCAAAGLPPPQLHPSVVGVQEWMAPPEQAPEQILLHWGERKPDKGRELALTVLEQLLDGPALPEHLAKAQWCFHAASRQPPPPAEAELLQRADQHGRIRVLEGALPRATMLQELARSSAALLPYCPLAYAERSSGVLWLYAAARLACARPARVVGYGGGWLAAEAPALGLPWQALPPAARAADVLAALAQVLQAPVGAGLVTPYGQQVLGSDWGSWLADRLAADRLS
jgi:hypothetical protein